MHRDQYTQCVRRHLVVGYLRQAVDRWLQAIIKEKKITRLDEIKQCSKEIETAQNQIDFVRKIGKRHRKENQESFSKVSEDCEKETRKV